MRTGKEAEQVAGYVNAITDRFEVFYGEALALSADDLRDGSLVSVDEECKSLLSETGRVKIGADERLKITLVCCPADSWVFPEGGVDGRRLAYPVASILGA